MPLYLSAEERLKAAKDTLGPGIKIRNLGSCIDCPGYTSSGADLFCRPCATKIVEAYNQGKPIPMPSLSELKASRR